MNLRHTHTHRTHCTPGLTGTSCMSRPRSHRRGWPARSRRARTSRSRCSSRWDTKWRRRRRLRHYTSVRLHTCRNCCPRFRMPRGPARHQRYKRFHYSNPLDTRWHHKRMLPRSCTLARSSSLCMRRRRCHRWSCWTRGTGLRCRNTHSDKKSRRRRTRPGRCILGSRRRWRRHRHSRRSAVRWAWCIGHLHSNPRSSCRRNCTRPTGTLGRTNTYRTQFRWSRTR